MIEEINLQTIKEAVKEEDLEKDLEEKDLEEEDLEEEDLEEENLNKEEALEYLVWSILLNVSRFGRISFASLYKELDITPSSEVWVGPKICWVCAQSPEFSKLIWKRGKSSYQLSERGSEILEIVAKKFGDKFTIEDAYRLYEVSRKISSKELREYVKSL